MNTQHNPKTNRNLKILLARVAAERMKHGHVYQAAIRHDDWCPALVDVRGECAITVLYHPATKQSAGPLIRLDNYEVPTTMLRCQCRPIIEIVEVELPDAT